MARIRSIKPDFFTSETVASLPISARLTFIGLWTHVDDNGVALDNERLIAAALWPLEDDPLEALRRLSGDLQKIATAGLMCRYEHSGRRFLFITGWDEHQKISHPSKPRYPRPSADLPPPVSSGNDSFKRSSGESPEDLGSPPETLRPEQGAGSREQGREQGEESARAHEPAAPAPAERPAAPPPLDQLPAHPLDDFVLTDAMRRYASQTFPGLDVDFETKQFISHHRSVGSQRNSWPDAWQKWLRDSAKRGSRVIQLNRGATGPARSTTDERVAAALELSQRLAAREADQPKELPA